MLNAYSFDYRYNGADWGDLSDASATNECNENGQSPIDLSSDAHVSERAETFDAHYYDVEDVSNSYSKDTNTFPVTSSGSSFESTYSLFLGAGSRFDAQQFHWHAGSEHTIDGLRYDLELHTVHYPHDAADHNGYLAAALGIIFDRTKHFHSVSDKQVEVIDNFFEDLRLNKTNDPTLDTIRYGALISALDTSRRWVYTGSVTTPPCARKVYWNVLRTVYPIKQQHYDLFLLQLNRDTSTDYDVRISGNWRLIQPINTHLLEIVGGPLPSMPKVVVNNDVHPAWYLFIYMSILLLFFYVVLYIFVFRIIRSIQPNNNENKKYEFNDNNYYIKEEFNLSPTRNNIEINNNYSGSKKKNDKMNENDLYDIGSGNQQNGNKTQSRTQSDVKENRTQENNSNIINYKTFDNLSAYSNSNIKDNTYIINNTPDNNNHRNVYETAKVNGQQEKKVSIVESDQFNTGRSNDSEQNDDQKNQADQSNKENFFSE